MASVTATPRGFEAPAEPIASTSAVPPLENGDHLARPEFERRFDAMPQLKKAELIDGVVYMASPVGHERHGRPHGQVLGWLDRYIEGTPGVDGGADSSLRLDLDNMPQPDAFLYVLPEPGGRIRVDEEDYVNGAPELILEIASRSVSYDLHAKLNVYRRNAVFEYIVWRTRDRAVDWFALRDGAYRRLAPGPDGLLRSEVFPGLWLDPEALLRGDRVAMTRALNLGLASPEHAAFADRIRAAAAPKPEGG